MRRPRLRFTMRRLMVAVAVVALITTIVLAIPPTIDPLMGERGIRLGAVSYVVVVILLTCTVAAPLIAGVALSFSAASRARIEGRLPLRRLIVAMALLGVGLAIVLFPLPLDGLRQGQWLGHETFVAYYRRFRLWPGSHVTPCLEVTSRSGEKRTYPITVGESFPDRNVDFRTNADRTVIWVVEASRPGAPRQRVLCSLDLETGDFVGLAGRHPTCVSGEGGLPFPR
jgi:hypothetical protein